MGMGSDRIRVPVRFLRSLSLPEKFQKSNKILIYFLVAAKPTKIVGNYSIVKLWVFFSHESLNTVKSKNRGDGSILV